MATATPIDNTHWQNPKTISGHLLWMRRGMRTTPMQLLKLVYICHGWMLGLASQELVDEPVEAWPYGPVVPTVYHEYKRFGRYPIEVPINDRGPTLTGRQIRIVEAVHDVYKNASGPKLSALTHKPGTPWYKIFHRYGSGAIIPSPLIRDHYRDKFGLE